MVFTTGLSVDQSTLVLPGVRGIQNVGSSHCHFKRCYTEPKLFSRGYILISLSLSVSLVDQGVKPVTRIRKSVVSQAEHVGPRRPAA